MPTGAEISNLWQLVEGLLLFLITGGIAGVVKMLLPLRDDVRTIKQELFGLNGTNGIRGTQQLHARRLDDIDRRHAALDAVYEHEREQYEGPERRRGPRRLTDRVKDSLLDDHSH